MKSLEVQARIKQNAEEMQEYLRDMARWENDVRQRDAKLRSSGRHAAQGPRVREGGTVKVQASALPASKTSQVRSADQKTAAAHTYDKGYSKWEKFDVDRALEEADRDEQPSVAAVQPPAVADVEDGNENRAREMLTPANIVDQRFLQHHMHSVASARGVYTDREPEEAEREIGNEHFKRGDFQKAVRSYTRCLGMKKGNYLAFSNRAMAYLKLREFDKAEADASCALVIEPDHVKSLLRRATARTALGKFRAALVDLKRAQQLEPGNKTIVAEISKAKELLKSAMNRAPAVRISVTQEHLVAEEMGEAEEDSLHATADRTEAESVTAHLQQQLEATLVDGLAKGSAHAEQQREEGDSVFDMTEAPAPVSTGAAEKKETSTTTKPGTKSAKAGNAKPKKRAAKAVVSSGYDLERSLRIAGHDITKLTALFKDLRPQDGHKIFAENLEVDVVVEFLLAAACVYAATDATRVCAWFRAVSRASQFDLVKMLLTTSQKESLAGALRQVKDRVDVEQVLTIQRAYELPEL